jgi:hypothetical protein
LVLHRGWLTQDWLKGELRTRAGVREFFRLKKVQDKKRA